MPLTKTELEAVMEDAKAQTPKDYPVVTISQMREILQRHLAPESEEWAMEDKFKGADLL